MPTRTNAPLPAPLRPRTRRHQSRAVRATLLRLKLQFGPMTVNEAKAALMCTRRVLHDVITVMPDVSLISGRVTLNTLPHIAALPLIGRRLSSEQARTLVELSKAASAVTTAELRATIRNEQLPRVLRRLERRGLVVRKYVPELNGGERVHWLTPHGKEVARTLAA